MAEVQARRDEEERQRKDEEEKMLRELLGRSIYSLAALVGYGVGMWSLLHTQLSSHV